MTDPRYPIGEFSYGGLRTEQQRAQAIEVIERLPERLRSAVAPLSDHQLDTPYRSGGWTVRQVVHHLPDSHLNAYVRFKLALTESEPTIRPYDEALWAELPDSRAAPGVSLRLLAALHDRWVLLLRSLPGDAWQRRVVHPEHERRITLDELLGSYAWHCLHHLAHITALIERERW